MTLRTEAGLTHTILGLISSLVLLATVTHICYPSSWEVKTGGQEVQGHLSLHNELEANLGSKRPCLLIFFFSVVACELEFSI